MKFLRNKYNKEKTMKIGRVYEAYYRDDYVYHLVKKEDVRWHGTVCTSFCGQILYLTESVKDTNDKNICKKCCSREFHHRRSG